MHIFMYRNYCTVIMFKANLIVPRATKFFNLMINLNVQKSSLGYLDYVTYHH